MNAVFQPVSGGAHPIVSVLVPARNAQGFVGDAVRSVLAEHNTPLEVVVVDDGSTDGTRAELARIDDPRLRVIESPERGISAALNAGARAARGAFLARCDADDLFPLGGERLAAQVKTLENRPDASALAGGYATITVDGRDIGPLDTGPHEADLTDELLLGLTRTHLGAWLIRRTAWEAIGGARPWFESAEDLDLQCRLAEVGRVLYRPGVAYRYRLHDESFTHRVPTPRRIFFDSAVVTFALQRRRDGADDLERGRPPQPPAGNVSRSGRDRSPRMSAKWQAQGQLMAAANQARSRGDRRAALGLLGRALLCNPSAMGRWLSLARQAASLLRPHASPVLSEAR